jgi:hypothetical protein
MDLLAGSGTLADSPEQIVFRQLSVQMLLVRRLIGELVLRPLRRLLAKIGED